jgi:large conductance mechanosensitive channel protein
MFAQQITVQGVVKDQTGETVIGASVMEKGTTNGTITGIDGDFSLNMSPNGTLVVSFVGYKTQEVQVKGQKQLQVVLSEDAEMLDEVVVIGYGTMKKSDLTGAVSSIGNKDIKDSPVSNLGQAIQGKISGVQIVDAGKPGDNVSIKIRGLGSINNCDPLVVIDGVPTDLGLSSLNMADVERLDVLKDASATAIYGSRRANGVVIIGGAFGKIVTSIVNDIIMPPIGWLIGGVNFSDLKFELPAVDLGMETMKPATINYGAFIQTIIDFTIIAFCVFLLVKGINKLANLKKKEEDTKPKPTPEEPKPTKEELLLTEIRDLLKEKR